MSDDDGDSLNCSLFYSTDGLHWNVIAKNVIDTTMYLWDITEIEPDAYYLKVAVSDGKDWIADTNEIKLNVNVEAEGSKLAFWLLAGVFGGLAAIYLFFNLRKSRGISKVWGPDPYEDEKS